MQTETHCGIKPQTDKEHQSMRKLIDELLDKASEKQLKAVYFFIKAYLD